MKLQLNHELQQHLGLVQLRPKTLMKTEVKSPEVSSAEAPITKKPEQDLSAPIQDKPLLEKDELRLLVKILQAIGHECVHSSIIEAHGEIHYLHPNKTLVFSNLEKPDDQQFMYLAKLSDIITQPQLKRPVWEKLKTL